MKRAIAESETEKVTVNIRSLSLSKSSNYYFLKATFYRINIPKVCIKLYQNFDI